jgi:hypothetical protein
MAKQARAPAPSRTGERTAPAKKPRTPSERAARPAPQTIDLIGGHALSLARSPRDNVLQIKTPDGRVGVSITITPGGIQMSLTGAGLTLEAAGALAINAERLTLHGRDHVAITSDGDAAIRAAGDLRSEARIQTITANLGNVNIEANDDVELNGERVRLNC